MTPTVTIRKALADPQLLGNILSGDSWLAWRTLLVASMGEELTADERAIFTKLTGREHEPMQRVEELVAVVARRGGKSRSMSVLAAYIGGLCRHPLVPGERGVLLMIAPDQKQASIVLEYCAAAFEQSPILRQLIANRTADSLELTSGISIEVRAASFRRLRGPTYVAAICDEAAYFMSEDSQNPDTEIVNAIRPGPASTGGPLIIASSPYARRGLLYDVWKRHFGPDGDPLVLVAQGTSRTFNPSLPQYVVDRAMERDPASAAAEFLAQFRSDVESFISREAVEAVVASGVRERPPMANVNYVAFSDPAGGGGGDSFTLAIAHRGQDGTAVLDAIREQRPPFSPERTVFEFATLLRRYGVTRVRGDRYAGNWPIEQFHKCGVRYEQSAAPKSDLYRDTLPLINSRQTVLLDNPKLVNQLCSLERRTSRGGRDSIDHPPGNAHDDIVNACAGALLNAAARVERIVVGAIKGQY